MTTKKKNYSEDEFGVVSFHGGPDGDAWNCQYHDPFSQMLKRLNWSHVSYETKTAAIFVHDDLDICQSIAVSIFGKHWREHILAVYDRYIEARKVAAAEDK